MNEKIPEKKKEKLASRNLDEMQNINSRNSFMIKQTIKDPNESYENSLLRNQSIHELSDKKDE